MPNQIRETTTFEVDTLLTEWSNTSAAPAYGPLFQCAMGGTPVIWAGGTVASVTGGTQIAFTAAHGLSSGQAVTFSGEMRFVTAIVNATTIVHQCAFHDTPVAGSAMGPTINYSLAESLPSASIFDYWDPSTAVQRIVEGAAMDKMQIKVNGDFQEFDFSGPARDLVDSASFISGRGRTDAVSGGADGGGFRLHDCAGAFGRGVDGRDAGSVFDDHGGGADAGEQHRAAGEGVRERLCALHRGGDAGM